LAWPARATYVDQFDDPQRRILAVFDWLHSWFSEADFRGCAWINAFGELGANSPTVASATRDHKRAFRRYLARLVADSFSGCSARSAGASRMITS
jgi:hypothetical protein